MKNKKIDSLLKSLENQKGAVMVTSNGKSMQEWCGLGGYAMEDHGSMCGPSTPDQADSDLNDPNNPNNPVAIAPAPMPNPMPNSVPTT